MERKKILVIDDAPEVTKLLEYHLGKTYAVSVAHDGESGYRQIMEGYPDLVILDINLPKMGGIALYNKISDGGKKLPCPVIILTSREELGGLFKDLNVDGFITKPFEIERLTREVDTVIRKRYGTPQEEKAQSASAQPLALIVESRGEVFNRMAVAFLNAGYLVNYAKSGLEAIEKILASPPDVIVIALTLPDIPGDVICAKLRSMPRTMDIPYVLYVSGGVRLDETVAKRICGYIQVDLLETDDPAAILRETERLIHRKS